MTHWIDVEVESVLAVDRGRDNILCSRTDTVGREVVLGISTVSLRKLSANISAHLTAAPTQVGAA